MCKVDGCEGKHRAHGYCGKHYRQIRMFGRLTPEREYRPHYCTVPGCARLHHARGKCRYHFEKQMMSVSVKAIS